MRSLVTHVMSFVSANFQLGYVILDLLLLLLLFIIIYLFNTPDGSKQ